MTAGALWAWSRREERRRRAARRGPAALPPLVWGAIAGVSLAAEIARRVASGDPVSGTHVWVAAAIAALSVVVFGAPFRMYWRRDSALLARLPIDGGALYRLGLMRSAWAALHAFVPLAVGAAGVAADDPSLAIRHLALAAAVAVAAALIGPAVALSAGALIASDKAMAAMQSMTAEVGAPRTTWLGLFPGVSATAVGAALLAGTPWITGDADTAIGNPALLFALTLGVPLALGAVAFGAAPRAMISATREVAALDQERLAHVERTGLSAVERAWSSLVTGAGRAVYTKDVKLAHRRYPAPYFVTALGVLALWLVAMFRPDAYLSWLGAVLGGLCAYAVIMARRLVSPPIEHDRSIATLPIAPRAVTDAKRKHALLRLLATAVVGGIPAALRAPAPLETTIAVGAALVATAIACIAAARDRAD